MNGQKRIVLALVLIMSLFFMLIFVTVSQRRKRLSRIEQQRITAELIYDEDEEGSLLERLESQEELFLKDQELSPQDLEDKAKSILEKLQQKQEEVNKEEPLAVRVFRAARVDYEDSLSVTGDIKSLKEIKMRFEKEGVITDIRVKEGDIVKKGSLIAALDKQDAVLSVARAQSKFQADSSALFAAEKELELTQILFDKGAIVVTKLDEVRLRVDSERAKMQVAQEELKMAKLALEKTELLAPIDGIVGARDAEVGEFFTSRDIVINLLGLQDLYAEVGIVERDIQKVSIGQNARVLVDAYPHEEFKGVIGNLYPVVEGRSRTMKAEVNIIDDKNILLPGMFAQVEIFLAALKSSLMVPTMSLVQVAPDTMVVPVIELDAGVTEEMIKNGEGRGVVKLKEIDVGYVGPDYTQIKRGIREFDIIALEAHGEIENGRKVVILGVEEYGMNE